MAVIAPFHLVRNLHQKGGFSTGSKYNTPSESDGLEGLEGSGSSGNDSEVKKNNSDKDNMEEDDIEDDIEKLA